MVKKERYNPDIIILDDGFQHRKMKRDLDIVLVDSVNKFGNQFLLPAGPLREDLNNTIKKNLHIIHSASKGLLTTINDLLDLSKIEAGKIEIVNENYHILSVVNDVCAMIKSRNEEKKLDLHFNISENLPSVLPSPCACF